MTQSSTSVTDQNHSTTNPFLNSDEQLRQVDLCFVMDATGSMGSYIEATRRELKNLAQKLSAHPMNPRMAYALTLYRDHPPQDHSFVTQVYPLSENLDDIQQALNSAHANGGGDGPEAVVDGLYETVYRTQWRKGSHRVILLAGDAPPHGEGGSGDSFSHGCPCGHNVRAVAQEAREKGIAIFCLGIGNDRDMQQSFQQIATIGGGEYVPLKQASKLIHQVLAITLSEFGKIDIDRLVFAAYQPDTPPHDIAYSIGLPLKDVMVSLNRLRRKEMIQ